MKPQEKAKELVEKFNYGDRIIANHCALICVAEILKLNLKYGNQMKNGRELKDYYEYWQEVKQEINKL